MILPVITSKHFWNYDRRRLHVGHGFNDEKPQIGRCYLQQPKKRQKPSEAKAKGLQEKEESKEKNEKRKIENIFEIMKREADKNRVKRAMEHIMAAITNINSIKDEHRMEDEHVSLESVKSNLANEYRTLRILIKEE